MKNVVARLLEYVAFDTQSHENTGKHPSSPGQKVFAEHLAGELREAGAERIRISEHAYVFAELPASPGCEDAPALGLIAHMDTSDAASGRNVRPRVVTYQGGVFELGHGRTLDPARFPVLRNFIGRELVVADGSTLLGADDKAGIAAILDAVETVTAEKRTHGPLKIAFTPDEEIGEGTLFFDVADFGAKYAYTVDGGTVNAVEYQNFNAAQAEFTLSGVAVHPGYAKGVMVNALKKAGALLATFPDGEAPENTAGFEGFFHPVELTGSASEARLKVLIRDHDAAKFEQRKQFCRELAERFGAELRIRDQYRNMEEVLQRHMFLVDAAQNAIAATGRTPETVPIRGGTDGAALSWRNLPCPNLGTGGYNTHGECEFAAVDELKDSVKIVLALIDDFAKNQRSRNV